MLQTLAHRRVVALRGARHQRSAGGALRTGRQAQRLVGGGLGQTELAVQVGRGGKRFKTQGLRGVGCHGFRQQRQRFTAVLALQGAHPGQKGWPEDIGGETPGQAVTGAGQIKRGIVTVQMVCHRQHQVSLCRTGVTDQTVLQQVSCCRGLTLAQCAQGGLEPVRSRGGAAGGPALRRWCSLCGGFVRGHARAASGHREATQRRCESGHAVSDAARSVGGEWNAVHGGMIGSPARTHYPYLWGVGPAAGR